MRTHFPDVPIQHVHRNRPNKSLTKNSLGAAFHRINSKHLEFRHKHSATLHCASCFQLSSRWLENGWNALGEARCLVLNNNSNNTLRNSETYLMCVHLFQLSWIESLTYIYLKSDFTYINSFCKITYVYTSLEPLYVVIEFVPGGSLDKLLHNSQVHGRIGQEDPAYANIWSRLTERELLQIASDIANGMKHLESKLASNILNYWCSLQHPSSVAYILIIFKRTIGI